MALFNEMTQTKTLHVAYKGGGPAVIALVSGETHVFITGIAAVIPQIKVNRLRALAVTSAERTTQFPEIPTLSEAGVPGYELTAWIGFFRAGRDAAGRWSRSSTRRSRKRSTIRMSRRT